MLIEYANHKQANFGIIEISQMLDKCITILSETNYKSTWKLVFLCYTLFISDTKCDALDSNYQQLRMDMVGIKSN